MQIQTKPKSETKMKKIIKEIGIIQKTQKSHKNKKFKQGKKE